MTDVESEIDAVLSTDAPIPRGKVISWIRAACDLKTLAKLYRLTGESYSRIQPDLGSEETCGLIQTYLLECIRQNVTGREDIEGRWEAAQTLHGWFCHLSEQEDTSAALTMAANAVTELFLTSGADVRNAIEQGFLEHALEMASLRPYFEHWSADARLRDTWERALEWGKTHPDFTWGMLKELRRIQEE